MHIRELVKQTSTKCKNNLTLNKSIFDKEVNQLFSTAYSFNEELFAHLYASCASNEKVCLAITSTCSLKNEDGYQSLDGLVGYFRLLFEMAIKGMKKIIKVSQEIIDEIFNELERVYQTIELLKHREQHINAMQVHVDKIFQAILALPENSVLTYYGGHRTHAIYFNFRRFGSSQVLVVISNLGDGCSLQEGYHQQAVNNAVYARGCVFPIDQSLKEYLSKIAIAPYNPDPTYAKQIIYPPYTQAQKDYDKLNLLYEISQKTGNCVIKNKLFAMRDAVRNDEAYNEIYKLFLTTSLSNKTHLSQANDIPTQSDICFSILASQISFLQNQNSCQDITQGMLICKPMTQFNLNKLLTYIVIGMVIGGVIGGIAKRTKSLPRNLIEGTLVGGLSLGLFAWGANLKEESKEDACQAFPSTSEAYSSCTM